MIQRVRSHGMQSQGVIFSTALMVGALYFGVNSTLDAAPILNPGNGHYYEVVWHPAQLVWNEANAQVASMTHIGIQGYLATITTAAENDFLANMLTTIGPETHQVSWLGGQQVAGDWLWITGETWGYENFNPLGANSGTDLQMWWLPQSSPTYGVEHGTWNAQVAGNDAGSRTYIVEYDVPEPATLMLFATGLLALARRL